MRLRTQPELYLVSITVDCIDIDLIRLGGLIGPIYVDL